MSSDKDHSEEEEQISSEEEKPAPKRGPPPTKAAKKARKPSTDEEEEEEASASESEEEKKPAKRSKPTPVAKATEISKASLQKEIAKILKNADLATTTAKKVRLQLEKNLGVNLLDRKEDIGQMVMDYVEAHSGNEKDDSSASSDEESLQKKQEKKKPKSSKKKGDSDSDWGKKQKAAKAKKAGGGRKGGGYTRAYKLSPELGELMGAEEMPRHEVVKRVWAIVKEKKLYDPNNKHFTICDDALYKVIGTKRFRTFGMMKYLKNHFLSD